MIYFIRCALTGRVKIGFSDEPWARFSQIQTTASTELTLVAIAEGDKSVEAALHQRFTAHHVRGEWFAETGALADHIQGLPPAQRPPRKRRPSTSALCSWMSERKMLNRELAEIVGVNPSFISHLRAGIRQPLLPLAVKLVVVTGLPYEAFLVGEARMGRRRKAA